MCELPMTPGESLYIAYAEMCKKLNIVPPVPWDHMAPVMQEYWQNIARATVLAWLNRDEASTWSPYD